MKNYFIAYSVVTEKISCFIFVGQQKYFNYEYFPDYGRYIVYTYRKCMPDEQKKKRKQPILRALNRPTRRTSDHAK